MYIDAKLIQGRLWVSQRDKHGNREVASHTPPYIYYYADPSGLHKSIYGEPVKRAYYGNRRSFEQSIAEKTAQNIKLFETDYNVAFRYLEETFEDDEVPDLRASFFDIEVETIPELGWARPDKNPYGRITAVTVVNSWEENGAYTLIIPPKNHTVETLRELFKQDTGDGFGPMDEAHGYYVCENERELLDVFLALIEESDVILGWNSAQFDLPYIINRIRIVHGGEYPEQFIGETGRKDSPFAPTKEAEEALMRLNLFPCLPTMRLEERQDKFNKSIRRIEKAYYLHGRVHMDYMEMFKKFTLNTLGMLHSYGLDFVLRTQLDDSKLEYEGSLEQLFHENPRRYAAYNRQDTVGPARLDKKFKLVYLANRLAHMAGVTLDKATGSTTIIEHAIMKLAHRQKKVRENKPKTVRHEKIPGAFVVEPMGGIYELPSSIDVQSLYPSAAMMLNLSPETMVGQFQPTLTSPSWNKYFARYGGAGNDQAATKAWGHFTATLEYEEIQKQSDVELVLRLQDGTEISQTAAEWYKFIREEGFALSGNATLFSQTERGIFSGSIETWFSERIKAKAKAGQIEKKRDAEKDPVKRAQLDAEFISWDTLQMAFKIFMNSAYGASASPHFVFYDPRLGKSITLSGRLITKHMIRQTCKELTGNYDFDRNALIYGDTDSVYFRMDWYIKNQLKMDPNEVPREKIIEWSNEITKKVNSTFPQLLKDSFFCNEANSKYIRAVRDVVGIRGLFKNKKKRYAVWVIDKEGKPKDEIKIVGMETKRTNTPKYMQKFLEDLISRVLRENLDYATTYAIVDEFRETKFTKMNPWEHGRSMGVKNLDAITEAYEEYESLLDQGYVGVKKPSGSHALPAVIATNKMIELNKENRWDKIRESDSVEILYLLPNPDGFKTVALPVGATYIPEWFKQLPFDTKRNQQTILDAALENTIGGPLGWDFTPKQNASDEVFVEEDFFS